MTKHTTHITQTAIAAFIVFAVLALVAGVTGGLFVLLALGLALILGCLVALSTGGSAKGALRFGKDKSVDFEASRPKEGKG